jgi:hypothetical protein
VAVLLRVLLLRIHTRSAARSFAVTGSARTDLSEKGGGNS